MRYSAPIDGLRAVAIVAVLVFHITPQLLPGGFVGVDVFFVVSGFLITSILLHDIRAREFSIREFYLRRIQRLLPNVIATVAAVLLLWAWLLPPSTARQTATHGLWALFNGSNIYIFKYLGGYWGNAAEMAPLTHTWSLGVEEQFYLVFPLTLLALSRTRRLEVWLLTIAAASLAFCIYKTPINQPSGFYLLHARVWQLLFGAALAARPIAIATKGRRELVGLVGLAMIAVSVALFGKNVVFPGYAALLPTVGTVMALAAISSGESFVASALSTAPMVTIGKLSYSLYLWHWPLITLGKLQAELRGADPAMGAIIGGLAGIALSVVAYVAIEKPLRNRGAGRQWRLAVIGVAFASTVVMARSQSTRALVADPQHRFNTPVFRGFVYNTGQPAGPELAQSTRYYDVTFPLAPPEAAESWKTGGIQHRYGGAPLRVVVIGSSHALMYSQLIDDICRDRGISVAFLGIDGRSIFGEPVASGATTPTPDFYAARHRWLEAWAPDVVVTIDKWDNRADPIDLFEPRLRQLFREMSALTPHVLWVSQVPVLTGGDDLNYREFVNWRTQPGQPLPSIAPNASEAKRKQLLSIALNAAAAFPRVRVLRPDLAFYQPDGSVRYADGRDFLYADDDHLSQAGANRVRSLFETAIIEATSRR